MALQDSPKTPAQRKADERARRAAAGQVIVQEWAYRESAAKLRQYAYRLRSAMEKDKRNGT